MTCQTKGLARAFPSLSLWQVRCCSPSPFAFGLVQMERSEAWCSGSAWTGNRNLQLGDRTVRTGCRDHCGAHHLQWRCQLPAAITCRTLVCRPSTRRCGVGVGGIRSRLFMLLLRGM